MTEDMFIIMMIMLVPILGIALGFFAVASQNKQKLAKLQVEAAKASSGGLAAQDSETVRELQERVQVLERIVTDGGYDLATRIEALREERPAELERLR